MAWDAAHAPFAGRAHEEAHAVTEEMREDFLATWDGIVEPFLHWEPWLTMRDGSEFIGVDQRLFDYVANGLCVFTGNQFSGGGNARWRHVRD